MIPLIDVMLVLLILFIITAPLFTPHAFDIEVPQAATTRIQETPDTIALAITAEGALFWENDLIDAVSLRARLIEAAQKKPQPALHLRADKTTQYEKIAGLMEIIQETGIKQIGFITRGD
jgi:biopolymer transport protein ExbD